jgi:ribosomal-protein-alanine N-acetyltransferase
MATKTTKSKYNRKEAAEKFGQVVKSFSEAVGEILNDPELRKKAKEFSQTVVEAASRVVDSRIEDDEVKAKFRQVGNAAQDLGRTISENFKPAGSAEK